VTDTQLFTHRPAVTPSANRWKPALVLVGAGQGLSITPLTTTVMFHSTPEHAGAISGALSTMQQVGNALGVAITGAVFYGAFGEGYSKAFGRSLIELVILLAGVALLTRLLPGRREHSATRGA
jgi:predicted MFS family arabinose efflux permease